MAISVVRGLPVSSMEIFEDTLYYDAVNNRIGIGTDSPDVKLHLDGTSDSYAAGPHMHCSVDGSAHPSLQILTLNADNVSFNCGVYYNGSGWVSSDAGSNFHMHKVGDKLKFRYDSGVAVGGAVSWNEGITLDTSGQVGIGTSTPGYELDVAGEINNTERYRIDGASVLDLSSGNLLLGAGAGVSGEVRIYSGGGNQRLTIDSAGKVGIGTDSPGHLVHLSSTSPQIRFTDTSTGADSFINCDSSAGSMYLEADRYQESAGSTIRFGVDAQEIMRIEGTREVGINTTTPDYALDVYSNLTDTYVSELFNDGNASARRGISIRCGKDVPSATGDCRWIDFKNGAGGIRCWAHYITTSPYIAFAASSDESLKKNIKNSDITGLDKINQIKLRKFDWKEKGRASEKMGYIAQEVESVIPEMVSLDDSGHKAITPAVLIPYLVKSIQELSAKIDQQQLIIEENEAMIISLSEGNI